MRETGTTGVKEVMTKTLKRLNQSPVGAKRATRPQITQWEPNEPVGA